MARKATRTITRYVKSKRTHKRAGFTVPVALIAGLMPGVARSVEGYQKDGFRGASYRLANDFTGYDAYNQKWNASELKYGLVPMLAGLMVHKLIGGKLGINSALGRAGVPFIRL